ncbi:sugar ABC transporter ATP-binding protein [Rhizobium ruizarguesonis]|uniref:Sugar ABC transporter ATP-binding protein n=1 Tax=Rhizobium ruizarguesonis TaxID=2081791 RepID=A0AB38HXF8_9HYPH|nr:sugar ABC transporter ATP-binding protein [Rhizobium ruizarguesonis]NEJ02900.1 ATP-binding cassette domain-containing protein [Rhizobium ruizarguesonis]NEJ39956.1 ATP-binding cassette domain-containing protein [Rhizobium ruizarguesonis]TAU92840.1 sugar ABC transporter ATP-binding protein [Rhizobium ruizarguesonis]TBA13393.1 sugar ABC transporter ATP-binding protein [Rhizobium ruizarguesonis]TBA74718.1 sugar ABC transporter ATP-binding protein [Rhizobium ruizarguesonis]
MSISGACVPAVSDGLELSVSRVGKSYGATVALEQADINLRAGEVHSLLGENGAGKSTLVRILAGAVVPDRGAMNLHGEQYQPKSITEARHQGVSTAFQELSLVPNLSVAQNLLLPRIPKSVFFILSARETMRRASFILARYNLERLDPAAEVSSLPLADRQRLEIARALENARRVLILDEPTASLAETDWLFGQIRSATDRGVAVLYISHRLAEVREICQRATVLRNGRTIASVSLNQASNDDIFEMMVGRRDDHVSKHVSSALKDAAPRLRVHSLSNGLLVDASFNVRPGEILAVAALEGQGQRSLFRCLAGLEPAKSGSIEIDSREHSISSPRKALKAGSGIAYLPEERKTEGILAGLSAATNIVVPILSRISTARLVGQKAEAKAAGPEGAKVELTERYLSFAIGDLSGGNQQKALIARTLATGARTLLLFDPTRGVDVGTKQAIYSAIRAFAASGGSVLFYSSELPEIVQLADRCMVLYQGKIAETFEGSAIDEQGLVAAMIGHRATAQLRVTR